MPKHLAVLLSAGALGLGVAACGGSSSSSSSAAPAGGATTSASATSAATSAAPATSSAPASSATTGGASTKLAIAANPTGMLMFSKSSLTAKAGTVEITFTNKAPEGHNFTIKSPSGATVGATPTFNGGSKTLTVKLAAGKYTFLCTVPGHAAGGMTGTLTVT